MQKKQEPSEKASASSKVIAQFPVNKLLIAGLNEAPPSNASDSENLGIQGSQAHLTNMPFINFLVLLFSHQGCEFDK